MKRLSLILFTLFISLLTGGASYAQSSPPTALINAALADLSARAGTTLTLDDLDYWRWSQTNYPDTSLNCAQAGKSYTQVLTKGYQFLFTYNGATFDYRASADGSILFLCSGPAVVPGTSSVQATAVPQTAATQIPSGQSVCPGAMNTRLKVGVEARVRVNGLAVNVRTTPTASSAKVTQINPGEKFNITGGPQCAENIVWWQIAYGQVTGWAGEGANGLYWIEPTGNSVAVTVPGTTSEQPGTLTTPPVPQAAQVYNPITSAQSPISAATAGRLDRFVDLPIGEAVTQVAWSPDGQLLAVTSLSGLNLYNTAVLTQSPRLFQVPNGPTLALAFSPDGSLLATAHGDATIRVWDLSVGGLRAVLRGHTKSIQTVAFSPDGRLMASAGGDPATGEDSAIRLWDVASRAQTASLSGHTSQVTSVAFSPDGTLLASGSMDTTVRLWDVASASPGTVLPNHTKPVRAVTFSPDGKWLASAGDDGVIYLWQVGPGTQVVLESTVPVTALAFSPDGSLLASAGQALNGAGDNAIRLWDVSSNTLLATLDTYGTAPDVVVTGLAFNKTGTLLAVSMSQGSSGIIRVFGVK